MAMREALTVLGLLVSLLFQQSQKAVIAGVVLTAGADTPIAGVQVGAYPVGSGAAVQATTNAEGRFSMSVDPGQYRLSATRQGFVPQRLRSNVLPGPVLTLAAGQRFSEAALRLVPTGTITGRIFDPEGRIMEGVSVSLSQLTWTADGRRMLQSVAFGPRSSTTN